MSRSIYWGLFMAVSSVWAMPPNPFQPHISPCEKLAQQLSAWTLKGVISSSTANTALMFSPQGTWRRIKTNNELFPGVQIENVGVDFVAARLHSACHPTSYRWEIKGKTDVMDADISSGVGSAHHKPG